MRLHRAWIVLLLSAFTRLAPAASPPTWPLQELFEKSTANNGGGRVFANPLPVGQRGLLMFERMGTGATLHHVDWESNQQRRVVLPYLPSIPPAPASRQTNAADTRPC